MSPTLPSSQPALPDSVWNRHALGFLLGLTLLRVLIHALGLVGVTGDEAYYWEWGNHLDLGYYSKPPLIGWTMGLLESLGLGTTFGLKLAATLLSTVALAGLYDFSRQWFGARTAWWTLAICGLSAGGFALSSFLTIDALLLPAWAVALAAGSRLLRNGPKPLNLLTLTLALGIGMLGKQMMMLFPVLLFIAAWRLKVGRQIWIAAIACSLLSFLALTPPVIWNAHHGWATIHHTAHHFEPAPMTPKAIVSRFGEFIGVQFMIAGPVALALAWLVLLRRETWPRYRMPLLFGSIGWLVCLAMTFRQEVNPNWPAVYLFSWLPAGIAWAIDHRPTLAKVALWTNAGITAIALALASVPSVWNDGDKKLWFGWDQLAREVDQLETTTPAGQKPLLIVAGNRFTAAQVAFRSARRPELHTWYYGRDKIPGTDKERGITSQFDLWGGPVTPTHRPVVVVVDEFLKVPDELKAALINPTAPKRVHVTFGRKKGADFDLIQAEGLTTWPQSPSQ